MFTILDRHMVRSYLKAYLICLVSLLGLFIVIDMFTHIDDFNEAQEGFVNILKYVGIYYLHNTAVIFDRLSETIVLLAAMFTIAWVQRNNELIPLLSAGVSTRRVVMPLLFGAILMLGLTVVNQEFVMPRVDMYMLDNRSNPSGDKDSAVNGAYEANGIYVTGVSAIRNEKLVRNFTVIFPVYLQQVKSLQAREARYYPPQPGKERSGGWMLTGVQPAEFETTRKDILEMIVPGQFFLKTSEITFERVTRSRNWHMIIPTMGLLQEILGSTSSKPAALAVKFHARLTRPVLGMILVFLGLSVILRDQNRNLFISAGMCLGLCGAFFILCFGCQSLGNEEILSPAFAAWLPVLIFGPISFVLFDAVHT